MVLISQRNPFRILFFLFIVICLASCTTIRKYQKNTPFVYKNIINLHVDSISSDDRAIIKSGLYQQLDDSSGVKIKDVAFFLHFIDRPPVFDKISAARSAENMQNSLLHLGYYNAKAEYETKNDTIERKQQIRVTTTYNVTAGKLTRIDTFAYLIDRPELKALAEDTKNKSPLKKNAAITKTAVQQEVGRLVDLYRNHGYYKFTPDQLRLTGDSSIEALTTVAADPFEAIRLLAEATAKRNRPTVRLAMILNPVGDSTKWNKYYINNIYALPDYYPGENYNDSSFTEEAYKDIFIRYHNKLFRNNLVRTRISFKKGMMYSQDDYYQTLNNLYKLNVWESPSIEIIEVPAAFHGDSLFLDLVIKLIPLKKYTFEGSIELSYSAGNNSATGLTVANAGNLLGLIGNLSVMNKNVNKEGIRMTNTIRGGVEFNTSNKSNTNNLINSNFVSFTNNLLLPSKKILYKQAFVNTNFSLINRIDFFNQQVINTTFGYSYNKRANETFTWRPVSIDFRRIYNRTLRFDTTLQNYPFLRYSFNTALVAGILNFSYTKSYGNPSHNNRRNIIRLNTEESGLLLGRFKNLISGSGKDNFLKKYLKEFIKADAEFTHTVSRPKSAMVYRLFAGVGVPTSKRDTTLPFFKQYYGGGPNSMRGWPVRGIGIGGQPLPAYGSTSFNDRTGDIQLEGNIEYRYNIAPLFSNAVVLKGALFVDAGNIWNLKNTKPDGSTDSSQFKFKNLYKQLGVSAGTGFRLDFSYFLVRFDLGFRIKRPDIAERNGWHLPDINLKNIFGTKPENKQWRYENFNFTIGIDYPF
ncbi:BamA/TamA family outer membrane protein [soil metagenome]